MIEQLRSVATLGEPTMLRHQDGEVFANPCATTQAVRESG
jgi:hypothetical protein